MSTDLNALKGSENKIHFTSRFWCKPQHKRLRGLNVVTFKSSLNIRVLYQSWPVAHSSDTMIMDFLLLNSSSQEKLNHRCKTEARKGLVWAEWILRAVTLEAGLCRDKYSLSNYSNSMLLHLHYAESRLVCAACYLIQGFEMLSRSVSRHHQKQIKAFFIQ